MCEIALFTPIVFPHEMFFLSYFFSTTKNKLFPWFPFHTPSSIVSRINPKVFLFLSVSVFLSFNASYPLFPFLIQRKKNREQKSQTHLEKNQMKNQIWYYQNAPSQHFPHLGLSNKPKKWERKTHHDEKVTQNNLTVRL